MLSLDVDIVLAEDIEDSVPCESALTSHQHPHDAAWYAISPCGDVSALCHQRRQKAFRDGGWKCYPKHGSGCLAFHEWDTLTWEPVRS